MPKPGDLSIVEQWSGEPVCIIETVSVAVLPFEQVGPEFAATEGEGDGSLEHWRTGHWAYIGRECARIQLGWFRRTNVLFQSNTRMLHIEHWSGIRDSIKAILEPPGARACWSEIKNRLNPEFRAFVDSLIAAHA